ncbi:long-chain fatty acid--CoA ligase [Amorphoplanes nipponensis]|uniref:Long-chain-fatty-acid--CoA ligase n=1 Tax=Actinoplanes nipponensis TaxID=135950 RepID=A0A919MK63_9ACTN|nr:class I adenylate-forming enzyme family protein [Actinoplanes nipponensis]GIE47392.1 long-chain-fatty-acid--CoA ligase [Actinoplanes nipponensis]
MTELTLAAAARPAIDYPAGPADRLLRRAAARRPDQVAISARTGHLTFAQLDEAVDRAAAALTAFIGGPGQRIGVATELSVAFAVGFYAVLRSGNVVVTLNPMHRPERIAGTLTASGATLALVPDALRDQLSEVGAALPPLLILGDAGPGSLGHLAATAGPVALPEVTGDDIACVHFTSGTTGEPKGVLLSHRNLIANAAQTAQAHGLDADAVSFNALPAYHLMHLGAAVLAGATQVLHGAPALAGRGTVADSLVAAARAGATHYYTLPMLLAMLARDPGPHRPDAGRLRGMFCGGSALAAAVARALSARFGIPVVQGYGLAEASSMTHLDRPDRPRPGSVGMVAADTECRIVDVDSRLVVPTGRAGEIEVRGPQIMAGYADGATGTHADGWLATGDVGRLDDDGYLWLVDRLKDVFKCDNELVSPSELEEVLGGHPAVRECAVVDRPDPVRGAVPVALLVLADPLAAPAAIIADANTRLASFQQITTGLVVDALPRTPVGKIARRDLRRLAADRPERTAPC